MSKFVAPRIALLAIAAAFFASACATESTNTGITGPSAKGPATDVIVTDTRDAAGNVVVCIDPTSPAGDYIVNTTAVQPATGTGVISTPVTITLPGAGCDTVFTRTAYTPVCVAPGNPGGWTCDYPQSEVTAVVTPPGGAASTGLTCILDQGTQTPIDCVEPDGGAAEAVVYANFFHGTQATFSFENTQTVCTYTIGWYKNKGAGLSGAFDFDGGVDNGLSILNTSPKGNPYLILAHQYIAASLNSGNGALLTGATLTAYNNATTYFGVASAGTPLPGSYTKAQVTAMADVLDAYNNGLSGTPHCD
jgi:hypothetical protein